MASKKWNLVEQDGCWITQKMKYSLILVDRACYEKYFTRITDSRVINYINEQYELHEDDKLLI